MRILVTGATGLLGKTLCPLLDDEGWQYWACNSKIFDITNTKMVTEIMNKISLDFIIHLAAYTNIDQAEDNPKLAYDVNQLGTRNIAKIAKKHDTTFLMEIPKLHINHKTRQTQSTSMENQNS